MKSTLCTFVVLAGLAACAQQAETTAAPVRSMVSLRKNPDAWNIPATVISWVNVNGALDAEFLNAAAETFQLELSMPFNVVPLSVEGTLSGTALAAHVRAALPEETKMFVALVRQGGAEPILAAPQSGWSIMDADWVTSAAADEAKTKERMGKQLYRALGFAAGCGVQSTPQAVMYPARTPEDLDTALSRNYHPNNLDALQKSAVAFGMQPMRLKSHDELVALGLVTPRPVKPETTEKE
ncbi:MAG: hypothetical protein FWF84_00930 [Kiritimatiellaeota bacterium]|nr:hypothetical protein [Kiritimatiellota bacterium]